MLLPREDLFSPSSTPEDDEKVLEPLLYINKFPSRAYTNKLLGMFNYWLELSPEVEEKIKTVMQITLHGGTLLDDIEDGYTMRKGKPVAHLVYGIGRTLNAGCYAFFIAMEKLSSLDHPEVLWIYVEEALKVHTGQGLEMYWRENVICPTEEEYKDMVQKKNSGFLIWSRVSELFSKKKIDLGKVASLMALYLQIKEDYYNLCTKKSMEDKVLGEDITEGKFSFPIIHGIRSRPNDHRLMKILRLRTKAVEVKEYFISLLEEFGSLEYTRNAIADLESKLMEQVMLLGGNPIIEAFIQDDGFTDDPPDRNE